MLMKLEQYRLELTLDIEPRENEYFLLELHHLLVYSNSIE